MKRNTKAAKIIAAWLAFALLTLAMLTGVDRLLSDRRTDFFIADDLPANTLDVAVIGSSHVYRGVTPQILMDEYGVAAAIAGTPGQYLHLTIQSIETIYQRQQPKLIVVDLFGTVSSLNEIGYNGISSVQDPALDAHFANRLRKIATVELPDAHGKRAIQGTLVRKLSMLNPLKYALGMPDILLSPEIAPYLSSLALSHSQWPELTQTDYQYAAGDSLLHQRLGYEPVSRVFDLKDLTPVVTTQAELDAITVSDAVKKQLLEIIRLAERHGSELLFVELPYFSEPMEEDYYRQIRAYLTGQGATVVNMDTIKDGAELLPGEDYSDLQHMNYKGAAKTTRWLGAYIKARYELPDRRGDTDARYELWRANARSYQADAAAIELPSLTDYESYVTALKALNDDYLVILATCGSTHPGFTTEQAAQLAGLGLTQIDGYAQTSHDTYCAVLHGVEVLHESRYAPKTPYELYLNIDGSPLILTSEKGRSLKVTLDGKIIAGGQLGLHIVVYNRLTDVICDSVTVDYSSSGIALIR